MTAATVTSHDQKKITQNYAAETEFHRKLDVIGAANETEVEFVPAFAE